MSAALLTPRQREALLAYGQTGSQEAAAAKLGITLQTLKNHLSAAYATLGVVGGAQAIYVILGGQDAAATVPPAQGTIAELRRHIGVLQRRLAETDARARDAERAAQVERQWAAAAGSRSPRLMVDGHISLDELREWSALFDRDAGRPSAMRITAREWVKLLRYQVRTPGAGVTAAAID